MAWTQSAAVGSGSRRKYLCIIASLIPKELEVKRPLDDLSDEQLDAAIEVVQAIMAAQEKPTRAG